MKIAITGASGFIGMSLMKSQLSAEHDLLAISRQLKLDKSDFYSKTSFFTCDLLNPIGLVKALKECQIVIHLAAEMRGDCMYNRTISSTKNLLSAMDDAGVKRIILCSSISIIDYSSSLPFHTVDETAPLCRSDDSLGAYARMKRDQEILIREWAVEEKHALILRPGLVYSDNAISSHHLGFVRGKLALISMHQGQVPMVHINSVAKAFKAACDYEFDQHYKILNIIDDKLPTQLDYIRKLKTHGNYRFGLKISWRAYGFIAGVIRLLFSITGLSKKLPDTFKKNSTSGRASPFLYSNTIAQKSLEWTPMEVDFNKK